MRTSSDHLSPIQATTVPHCGNLGSVRCSGGSSGSGDLSGSGGSGGSGGGSSNGISGGTSACSSSNGVWAALRTSLFSTGALIADEHGDSLAATQ